MTKLKLLRVAAAGVTSLGLMAGFAGIAGASSATVTSAGPDSANHVRLHNSHKVTTNIDNDNSVGITNNNPQTASTGNAKVHENTTGGDATTGSSMNNSTLKANVTFTNNSGLSALAAAMANSNTDSNSVTVSSLGPDSPNHVKVNNSSNVTTTVSNNNSLNVTNNNTQNASTGNAKVSDNTSGGSATSGNATNNSTTDITFTVTN